MKLLSFSPSLSCGVFISPGPDCLSCHHEVQASSGPLTTFPKWQLFSFLPHYVFSSWFPFLITQFLGITSTSFPFVTWLSRSSDSCNILTFFYQLLIYFIYILIYLIYIKCLQWYWVIYILLSIFNFLHRGSCKSEYSFFNLLIFYVYLPFLTCNKIQQIN